jgi:hypothetical protein
MDNKEASKLYREQYNKGEELVPDYVYDTMFESSEAEVDDIGQGELIDHVHPMLSLPTYYLDIDTITEEIIAGLILAIDRCYHLSVAGMNIYLSMLLCHRRHCRHQGYCKYCFSHCLGLFMFRF